MSVGRICIREVDVADADESVWKAAERMRQRAVGTLVILNGNQEPVGIVTDRDLVERVLATSRNPLTTLVEEVMTADPMTISEDASIESALEMMSSARCRRLPVTDREGKLVGVLSMDDVLILLAEEFRQIGRLLEMETPRGVAEVAVH